MLLILHIETCDSTSNIMCVRLKQLITPIQELLVAPLQYTKINVSSTLFCDLLSGSLRCKK